MEKPLDLAGRRSSPAHVGPPERKDGTTRRVNAAARLESCQGSLWVLPVQFLFR